MNSWQPIHTVSQHGHVNAFLTLITWCVAFDFIFVILTAIVFLLHTGARVATRRNRTGKRRVDDETKSLMSTISLLQQSSVAYCESQQPIEDDPASDCYQGCRRDSCH